MSLDFTNGQANWDALAGNLKPGTLGGDKKSYKDDRFWKLTRDEADNGQALIRLLPDPDGKPFEKLYSHAVQSYDPVKQKKRWYLNDSPETIGEPCPASELWSAMYNCGLNEGKEEAKKFSRKINYVTNILVVKDPLNPENEGKVMLWKFGTKLFDKFMAALNPSDADRSMGEKPKELFNPLTGCDIRLKIKKANGFFNYDDTTIEPSRAVWDDGEVAKAFIIENGHKVSEFTAPENFKTYEESKKSLKWVCETYTPKNLDPVTFKNLVESTLPTVAEGAPEQQAPAQQAPVISTGMEPAPAAVTPAPVTPAAVTPAPVVETPAAVTPAPVTPAPVTPAPVTPAASSVDDDLDFLNELD